MDILNHITRSLPPPLTPPPQPTRAHSPQPPGIVCPPSKMSPSSARSPVEQTPLSIPSLSDFANTLPKSPATLPSTRSNQPPTLPPASSSRPLISNSFFTRAYPSIQVLRILSYPLNKDLANTSYTVAPEKLKTSLAYARQNKLCIERASKTSWWNGMERLYKSYGPVKFKYGSCDGEGNVWVWVYQHSPAHGGMVDTKEVLWIDTKPSMIPLVGDNRNNDAKLKNYDTAPAQGLVGKRGQRVDGSDEDGDNDYIVVKDSISADRIPVDIDTPGFG